MSFRHSWKILGLVILPVIIASNGFLYLQKGNCESQRSDMQTDIITKKLISIQYENITFAYDGLKNPNENFVTFILNPHNKIESEIGEAEKKLKHTQCGSYIFFITLLHIIEILISISLLTAALYQIKKT